MFRSLSDTELRDIYLDYVESKNRGIRCGSLIPFANKYRDYCCGGLSLASCLEVVSRMFLEEVAYRFFGAKFLK